MFSMGRDRRMPLGGAVGPVNSTFKTPANAAIAVGVLAAIPFLVTGAGARSTSPSRATGMIYISYFLCNIGVLVARLRGWPHQGAWFKLGSWGTSSTSWPSSGAWLMIINIAHLGRPEPVRGTSATTCANLVEPVHQDVHQVRRPDRSSWLPDMPFFEALVGLILIVGAIYYVVTRCAAPRRRRADLATGEAVIG